MMKTILLVDDDVSVRESVSQVLVAEGYEVLLAEDGDTALELARNYSVNLALLDLRMPKKSGWDTFEPLTREHPTLPVIIMTGRSNQRFTSLAAGVGALIEKPFEMSKLIEIIEQLLAQPAEAHLARLAGETSDLRYVPRGEEVERERAGAPVHLVGNYATGKESGVAGHPNGAKTLTPAKPHGE